MSIWLWILYLMFGFIAVAPLTQSSLFRVDNRYRYFWYVSLTLAFWWCVNLLRIVVENPVAIYILSLLIYPLVFAFVALLFIATLGYLKYEICKKVLVLSTLFFFINLGISITNSYHHLMLDVTLDENVTFLLLNEAKIGIFFYIHITISYILLITTVFLILRRSFEKAKDNKDIFPFLFFIGAIVVSAAFNLYHLFVEALYLDPTLLASIIFVSVLYYVFYIRDLKLILGLNRNHFILEHLREKYIIVNEQDIVVDASKEFVDLFDLELEEDISYQELLNLIDDSVVLYQSTEDVDYNIHDDKMYFHTIQKDIRLPFYKDSGTFYLFFDQTANLKYINEMNFIKTHDLMTGLYNRNYLEDIRDELDNNEKNYTVILFDIDGLKQFNDYLGHDKGDDLLIRFANQLLEVTTKDNLYPIRLGGDEFLILGVEVNDSVIDSIIKRIKEYNENKDVLEIIQYSYAVASNKDGKQNMKQILIEADELMYKMKKNKKGYKEQLIQRLKDISNI